MGHDLRRRHADRRRTTVVHQHADFSGHLPRTTSRAATAGWTALGGFLPSVAVCSIGAFAATAVDMSDPQGALQQILPGWFAPVFLLAPALGTIAVNALTA